MIKKAVKYFLIFLVVCIGIGTINNMLGGKTTTHEIAPVKSTSPAPAPAPPPQKQYYAVDANTMMADLARNAAAAQAKYKGQPLAVVGRIGVIDSNGTYVLVQDDNEYSITGVICNVSNKDQLNFIYSVQVGQYIRAYGTITDVGEVMGYVMSVDRFES